MSDTNPILKPEGKQELLSIFERLLPLLDGLTDKIRFVTIIGFITAIWLAAWSIFLKHYPLGFTIALGISATLPTFILARYWWVLEDLKNLPDIAGQMAGDAKNELQESVQTIRAGKMPKLSLFNAGKSLWSVRGMASEIKELVGSYINVAILINPVMLILGIMSFVAVFLLFFTGIVLAFFAF